MIHRQRQLARPVRIVSLVHVVHQQRAQARRGRRRQSAPRAPRRHHRGNATSFQITAKRQRERTPARHRHVPIQPSDRIQRRLDLGLRVRREGRRRDPVVKQRHVTRRTTQIQRLNRVHPYPVRNGRYHTVYGRAQKRKVSTRKLVTVNQRERTARGTEHHHVTRQPRDPFQVGLQM